MQSSSEMSRVIIRTKNDFVGFASTFVCFVNDCSFDVRHWKINDLHDLMQSLLVYAGLSLTQKKIFGNKNF